MMSYLSLSRRLEQELERRHLVRRIQGRERGVVALREGRAAAEGPPDDGLERGVAP